MKVLQTTKRTALSRGKYPCAGEIHTLNITRGCAGSCVFCYARCIAGVDPDTVSVYQNLPMQLRLSLDSKRRRTPPPSYVVMSTSSDAFLGGEPVLQITRQCLQILVNRGVGLSFSTRGDVPDDIIELLRRHARHVRVFIPLASMDEEYTSAWEPGTLSPARRLFLAQRLMRAGITPRIRMEPMIPYVNDQSSQIREVISAVESLGLHRVIASFFHIRPGVQLQLEREAPAMSRRLVLGSFPWLARRPHRWHHLPHKQRAASLGRIQRLAAERDVDVDVCHCQNRDLSATRCPLRPPEKSVPRGGQASLFD